MLGFVCLLFFMFSSEKFIFAFKQGEKWTFEWNFIIINKFFFSSSLHILNFLFSSTPDQLGRFWLKMMHLIMKWWIMFALKLTAAKFPVKVFEALPFHRHFGSREAKLSKATNACLIFLKHVFLYNQLWYCLSANLWGRKSFFCLLRIFFCFVAEATIIFPPFSNTKELRNNKHLGNVEQSGCICVDNLKFLRLRIFNKRLIL